MIHWSHRPDRCLLHLFILRQYAPFCHIYNRHTMACLISKCGIVAITRLTAFLTLPAPQDPLQGPASRPVTVPAPSTPRVFTPALPRTLRPKRVSSQVPSRVFTLYIWGRFRSPIWVWDGATTVEAIPNTHGFHRRNRIHWWHQSDWWVCVIYMLFPDFTWYL